MIGKTAFAGVQLVRRYAQIHQHAVQRADVLLGEQRARIVEIAAQRAEAAAVHGAQPRRRRSNGLRVAVDAKKPSAVQMATDLRGMAAAAQRAVQVVPVRTDIQPIDALVEHDRKVIKIHIDL